MAVQGRKTLVRFFWLCHCGFRALEAPPCKGETTVLALAPAFHNWSRRTTLGLADGFWKLSAQPWRQALASFRFNPSCGHTLQRQQHVGKEKLPGQFGQPVGL